MRLCAAASPKYSSGDRRLVVVEIAGQPTPDVPFLLRPQALGLTDLLDESHNGCDWPGGRYLTDVASLEPPAGPKAKYWDTSSRSSLAAPRSVSTRMNHVLEPESGGCRALRLELHMVGDDSG